MASPPKPLKRFLFAVVYGSHECRPHWLLELEVLAYHLSGGCYKSWALDIGSQIFTHQGEGKSCEFSPVICLCAKGGIYGKNVS